jgi:tetratricopeptide (TPR) repeat protein
MILLFVSLVTPKIDAYYKDTQYMLIDGKVDKCNINIRKGLELNPHNTNLLIVKAYIHRSKEEYEQALCDLELANKTLKDPLLETELRNQIALTYNEMGTFLFKKKKFTEAIALFNEGIAFKPTDWGMRANRGDCYKALNDYNKALEDYIHSHNLSNGNEEVNFRLGGIYNSRGIAYFNNRNPKQAII